MSDDSGDDRDYDELADYDEALDEEVGVEDDDLEDVDADEAVDEPADTDIIDEEVAPITPEKDMIVRLGPALADEHHRRIIAVDPADRITSSLLQDYEMVAAINFRTSQIEQGAPIFIDVGTMSDPAEIAKAELLARRSPLKLRRVMQKTSKGDIIVEYWDIREMAYNPAIWRESEPHYKKSAAV